MPHQTVGLADNTVSSLQRMTSGIHEAMRREGVLTVEPSLHRNLLRDSPELFAAVVAGLTEPWVLPVAEVLLKQLPYPPSRQTPLEGSFFRLPFHQRAFYYTPEDSGEETQPVRGVIAIKGASPLAEDFDDWLIEMRNMRMSPGSSTQTCLSEHFALCEHKIPGALSLREAEAEAQVAAEVQERHLRFYKEMAPLPLPLIIHKLPEECARTAREILERQLSTRAMSRIEDLLDHGLVAYLYYYPSIPIRVTQLNLLLPTGNHAERFDVVKRRFNPEEVIVLWARGFVRLMFLGYLPAALGSRGTGNCCNPKNAVVDGGFTDLDSIIPTEELADDLLFEETLHYSFSNLCRTVREFLVGKTTLQTSDKDLVDRWIAKHVATLCRGALETESRDDLMLDPRVRKYFDASMPYDSLTSRINRYYSSA